MNQGTWIPTSTELYPEDGKTVQVTYLGYHNNEPMCDGFAYRSNGKWFWNMWDEDHDSALVPIVAWRYCEPYNEKQIEDLITPKELTPEQLLHIHKDFKTLYELSQYIHYLEDVKKDYEMLKGKVLNLADIAEKLY